MNKRFKKVISSVLAAVMTLGVVGVVNVSSVFAEEDDPLNGKTNNSVVNLSESGAIATGTNVTYNFNSTGFSSAWDLNEANGYKGLAGKMKYASKATYGQLDKGDQGTYYIEFTTAAKTSTVVTFTSTNSNKTKGILLYKLTSDGTVDSDFIPLCTSTTDETLSKTLGAGTYRVVGGQLTIDETTYGTKNHGYISTMSLVTLSGYGLAATNTDGYAGTFSFSPSRVDDLDDDTQVTISYTGDDYEMEDTIVKASEFANNDTNMTATYDVSNLTLTKKTIHVVKVEPTIDGNVTEYNFVTDTTERLVAQADAGSTSAYSIDYKADEEADEASCYVLLTSKGAKLYDDDANKGVATLVIPFKATRGTYTINGEVTPTQNVGGKWNVVDFGTVAIMADSKKNVAFANRDDNGSIYSENVGAIAVGSKITYSVVFDLDNETATATITNGSTTETIEASCDSISDIKFVTNGSGYISKSDGRTDRELLIPSVTITKNSEPKTVITKADENNVAYVKVDGNKYAIAIIGSDNLDKDGFNLSYANEDDRLKDDLHEVYEKVTINGNDYTSASLTNGGITNAYLYGFKVSSSDAKAIIGETTVTYTAKTTTTE